MCGECEAWIAGPGFEPLSDEVAQAARLLPLIGGAADEREHWLLFDLFNKRNVAAAYAEREWDQ